MSAGIFLPHNADPPYQTIICFPGTEALGLAKRDRKPNPAFIVKEGRALVWPSYRGTYERINRVESVYPSPTPAYQHNVVSWVTEFRRCVDYLESRPETFDVHRLGYLGYSWGGTMGAVIPAIETRLSVSVVIFGGLNMQHTLPAGEPINFLPRVKVPTLMINNRRDFVFQYDNSQEPMFDMLGAPEKDKRHALYDDDGPGHWVPPDLQRAEVRAWLDTYWGAVRRRVD